MIWKDYLKLSEIASYPPPSPPRRNRVTISEKKTKVLLCKFLQKNHKNTYILQQATHTTHLALQVRSLTADVNLKVVEYWVSASFGGIWHKIALLYPLLYTSLITIARNHDSSYSCANEQFWLLLWALSFRRQLFFFCRQLFFFSPRGLFF